MKLLYLILSTRTFFTFLHEHYYYEEYQRCGQPTGIYIIRLRVTWQQAALIAIQEYLSNFNAIEYDYQTAAEAYMSEVFREVNMELNVFGVHLRADYGQLIMENFPFSADNLLCHEENAVEDRMELAKEYFEQTAVHGVGNRLMVIYCHNYDNHVLAHKTDIGDCGHLLGILYHDPHVMKSYMKNEILDMFIKNTAGDHYNEEICKYARSCVTDIGNAIGEYVNNLRNIKDVAGFNFYLPVDSRTKMHGVYDDIAFGGPFHGVKRMYPWADHYNHSDQFLYLKPN